MRQEQVRGELIVPLVVGGELELGQQLFEVVVEREVAGLDLLQERHRGHLLGGRADLHEGVR